MVARRLLVCFVIAVFSLGFAGAGFSAEKAKDAQGGIVTKIENGNVYIKDNKGETVSQPESGDLTGIKVGDPVSVKDGKFRRGPSTPAPGN